MDNNVESGAENVEDIIEDKEETGSILQDETAKENLVKLVEEEKNIEEPDDAKQENIEESDKETSNLWTVIYFVILGVFRLLGQITILTTLLLTIRSLKLYL